MTNEPQEPLPSAERFTDLQETSAKFGIVLRSLYDTYSEDVTVNQHGEQELVLLGPSPQHPKGTRATISKTPTEIVPTLTLTIKAPQGLTLHTHYTFDGLVYERHESATRRNAISGMEEPIPIDPDGIEPHPVTSIELNGRLKFIGTLKPLRIIEEENARRYSQAHRFKSFVGKILGKKPE